MGDALTPARLRELADGPKWYEANGGDIYGWKVGRHSHYEVVEKLPWEDIRVALRAGADAMEERDTARRAAYVLAMHLLQGGTWENADDEVRAAVKGASYYP